MCSVKSPSCSHRATSATITIAATPLAPASLSLFSLSVSQRTDKKKKKEGKKNGEGGALTSGVSEPIAAHRHK